MRQSQKGSLPVLGLSALGIVFGDIGTSPLYTFKTILGTAATPSDPATVLGALSLVLWTLFIITTVKYVLFAMRVDNDGEGGILALMALLGVKKQQRPTIVAVGLFGAALIYATAPSRRRFRCCRRWKASIWRRPPCSLTWFPPRS